MTPDLLRSALAWSALLNYLMLVFWFVLFALAHDWLYRLHSRWFSLSREAFDTIHYGGMAFYKIGIFLCNLMPYLALRILL